MSSHLGSMLYNAGFTMNIQVEERMQMQGVEGEGGRQIPVVDFR